MPPPVQKVAVRGIGILSPGKAIGVEAFRQMISDGRSAIAPVSRFDTADLSAHRAGLLEDFNPKDFIAPMKLRRMNNLSRMGLAASRLALTDAAIDPAALSGEGTGISIGTSFGPVQTSVDYMQEYVEKGASLAPPQLFAESVANAPGSHIAIDLECRGFNITFTQRESSALVALMYAASQIVKGTVRGALAGGVEEMNEMTFSVLDRMAALAHAEEGIPEEARPFDRRRNGLVVGEGAAMFILGFSETPTTGALPPGSNARGIYGYLSGFGIAKDPTAEISSWGTDADAVIRAMAGALEDAGITAADVDAIWASANSSIRGDRLEYRAIQQMFGSHVPPVVATKGYFGEYTAAGGLQVATAMLALRDQKLPASPGFTSGEDEMTMEIVQKPRDCQLRHILINSLSAGGGIVSAVVSSE